MEPLTLRLLSRFQELYNAGPVHAADCSFVNLWGWAEHYGLELCFENDLCWIRQNKPEPAWWSAVGRWQGTDWTCSSILQQGGTFSRVPEALALAWKEALGARVELAEARGQWEYLYSAGDLAALKGNKFHKKRNHVNGFFRRYPAALYRNITPDCMEEVLQMQKEWCRWHECVDSPALLAENQVIRRVLESWDEFPGLRGGVLYLEDAMIAYTVGQTLDSDTVVVHFEKGHPDLGGVYQAINQRFAEVEQERVRFINREQDLDEPGLRQAKESYNPVGFLKKYVVTVRPAAV